MQKIPIYIVIAIALSGLLGPLEVRAQAAGNCDLPNIKNQRDCENAGGAWTAQANTSYKLLEPLPGLGDGKDNVDTAGDDAFGNYLNVMIGLFIGICAVLAVVMIVIGGIEYATSELVSSKEAGIEKMKGAVLGLLLALGAVVILKEINPDLLNTTLDITPVNINVLVEEFETLPQTTQEEILRKSGEKRLGPTQSGLCSESNMAQAGFSDPKKASCVCMGESGGNDNRDSEVDLCKDGNTMSIGLFQINIIAHANAVPEGRCSGIFETQGGGTQGRCLKETVTRGGKRICIQRDCRVTNPTKYESCKRFVRNLSFQLPFAVELQRSRGWGQWGASSAC